MQGPSHFAAARLRRGRVLIRYWAQLSRFALTINLQPRVRREVSPTLPVRANSVIE
jgi:hypothetical protein